MAGLHRSGRVRPDARTTQISLKSSLYSRLGAYLLILIHVAQRSHVVETLEFFGVNQIAERNPYGIGEQAQVID